MTGMDWMPDDALVGPATGVKDRAAERLDAVDLGLLRRGQAPRRHDAKPSSDPIAAVGSNVPALGVLVPRRRRDAGLELDVAAQVEPVGDMVHVPQDLGLGRIALRPRPFLLELGRERVAVVHRLDVAARTGIPVPPPGAADVGSCFVALDGQAEPAQPVVRVEAGEAGAHHDRVDIGTRFGHDPILAPCATGLPPSPDFALLGSYALPVDS
jgi:hypothetical protein